MPSWLPPAINRALLETLYLGRHPLAALRHRRRAKIFAGPGTGGFAGGVFNPGVVQLDDGGVIAVAKGQHRHWIDASTAQDGSFLGGGAVLFDLRAPGHPGPLEERQIRVFDGLPDPTAGHAWEDFRPFRFGGEVWCSHSVVEIDAQHGTDRGSRIALARVDVDAGRLVALGEPQLDRQLSTYEKNWLFVETPAGGLHLLYQVDPWLVFTSDASDPLVFAPADTTPSGNAASTGLADVGGFGTFTGFSTQPVEWDEQHLIVLIHQVDPAGLGRTYHQWAVLIDRGTAQPAAVTTSPLLSGHGSRGKLRGALYAMSCLVEGDRFHVYCGEGDEFCSVSSFERSDIDRRWRDLPL